MVKLGKRFKKFAFIGVASALAASTGTAGVLGTLYGIEKNANEEIKNSHATEISMIQDELESEKQQNVYLQTEIDSKNEQNAGLKSELESKNEHNNNLIDEYENLIKLLISETPNDTEFNFTDNGVNYTLNYKKNNSDINGFEIIKVEKTDRNITNLEIPSSYKGIPIISIGKKALYFSSFQTINIPNSVVKIDDGAFSYCQDLQSINIPDSVKSIGRKAFEVCTRLQSINIPDSVEKIESDTFLYCHSLQTVNIPDSVKKICDCAFGGCESLQSITITETTKNNKAEKISIHIEGPINIKTIYVPEGFDINSITFHDWLKVFSVSEVLKDVEIVAVSNENTKDSSKDLQNDPKNDSENNGPQM